MINFRKAIDQFVSEYLPECPKSIRTDKIVHDSIWGTIRIRRHEVALLDTPLLQRLRRIHQTSFAYLTYPSAVHTRFEHSLGCLWLASEMIDELRRKDVANGRKLITEDVEYNVRAASLLHDIGHGPFSHSSEEIYGDMPELLELTNAGAEYENTKPHEVLSSLIILSGPFRKFVRKLNSKYSTRLDVDRMANAVCGKSPADCQYESDILNGSFDVDKIEYVIRDGRLMGLPANVDLSRLLSALDISTDPKTNQRILTVDINGEITLEQLVFGKMILFNSVYRHQKTRVCDCLLKGVFEYIANRKEEVRLGNISVTSPIDFLRLTDDMLSEYGSSFKESHPELHDLMHGLVYRRLPKRALAISHKFIEKADKGGLAKFLELRRNHADHRKTMRQLANKIWNCANQPCPEYLVWLDLPKAPSFKEGDETTIREPDGNLLPLNEFFNVDQWAEHFDQHKWRGHVYAPEDSVENISKAAREVLSKEYDIEFKPIAWQICHINSSIN